MTSVLINNEPVPIRGPMSRPLQFMTLGPLIVVGPSGELKIRSAVRRRILSYLLLSPRGVVSVDRLQAAGWPDGAPANALRNTQAHISHLRSLGLDISRHKGGYVLDVEPEAIDSVRFHDLATQAWDQDAGVDKLELALEWWRGTPWSDLDSATVGVQRDGLEELRQQAEERLMFGHLVDAAGVPGLVLGERLVADAPRREMRWALLAAVRYKAHLRSDALLVLERATEAARDVGLPRGPLLASVEQLILHDAPLSKLITVIAPDYVPLISTAGFELPAFLANSADLPMVGRDHEYSLLDESGRGPDGLAAASGGVALVVGSAGAGKTRLLAELAERRCGEGSVVVAVSCDTAAAMTLAPVGELLRRLGDQVPDLWDSAPIARLTADEHSALHLEPSEAPIEWVPDHDSLNRIAALVGDTIRMVASRVPILVIVDDVHLVDQATSVVLDRLVRSASRGMSLVLGSRSEAADRTSFGSNLTRSALDATYVRTVELGGLDRVGIEEMALAVLGRPLSEAAAARIVEVTGGNALYVREVLRMPDVDRGVERAVPFRVSELIVRRLEALSPLARKLCERCAVMGHRFGLDVAVAATVPASAAPDNLGQSTDIFRAVVELESHGLVHVEQNPAVPSSFNHDLTRQAVLESLDVMTARQAHTDAANAYDQLRHTEPWLAARHGWLAADAITDEGLASCSEAADVAVSRLRYTTAIELLTYTLQGQAQLYPTEDRRRAELLLRRATALRAAGLEADHDLEEVYEIAVYRGDRDLQSQSLSRLIPDGIPQDAVEWGWLQRAYTKVDEWSGEGYEYAIPILHALNTNIVDMTAAPSPLLDRLRKSSLDHPSVERSLTLARLLVRPAENAERLELTTRLAASNLEWRTRSLVVRAHIDALAVNGQLVDALRFARQATEMARSSLHLSEEVHAEIVECGLLLAYSVRAVRDRLDSMFERLADNPAELLRAMALSGLGLVTSLAEYEETAQPLYELFASVVDNPPVSMPPIHYGIFEGMLAYFVGGARSLSDADRDRALELNRHSVQNLPLLTSVVGLHGMNVGAVTAYRIGDDESYPLLAELVAPHLQLSHWTGKSYLGPVLRTAGIVAFGLGQPKLGTDYLLEGIRSTEREGAAVMEALQTVELAELQSTHGYISDTEQSARLRRAQALVVQTGAQHVERRLGELVVAREP